MRRAAALALVAAFIVPPAVVRAFDPCDARFCAGGARADITPPVGTPLWGYSARAFYAQFDRWLEQRQRSMDTDLYAKVLFLRSDGVHTRLYARALVLRDAAGGKTALVQTDLGAVTSEVHRAVANNVEGLGIARDRITISATHTHGGPGTVQQPPAHGLLVGDHFDPRTFKRIVDGVTTAIVEADLRLAPARIGIGQGYILDASVNRTLRAHAGTHTGSPPVNFDPCPDPAAYEADLDALGAAGDCDHRIANRRLEHGEDANHPHAIDPTVTVIRVDRTDGLPVGIWSSFAAHGTMVFGDDLRFSGDNQGVAERLIEQAIAERARAAGIGIPQNHEIVAAYANGTEGDVAPVGSGHNRFAAMEDSGRRQARAVMEVYDGIEMTDGVALDARWDWLYMDGEGGTSPVAILGAGPDCPFGKDEPFPDEFVPGHGRKCPFLVLTGTGPHWFGLQVLRIGNLVIGSVPGEMSVQMGRRVKARLIENAPDGTTPIIAGLANDYMAYLTTPEEYDVQDYEGTFTLWGREQGPLMAARLGDLADRLFDGRPNPAFVEPPDTSGTQANNNSPVTQVHSYVPGGRAAGTVVQQVPATVERGSVVQFSWVGGAPSAEGQLDERFVETQILGADGERDTVFWDEGIETIVDHDREGTEDRWGVQWDVTMDAPAGIYRFLVGGHAWADGRVFHYGVASDPFEVVASDDLAIASVEQTADGVRVHATYPAPVGSDHPNFGQPPPYIHLCSAARGAASCNYRWRAAGPETPAAEIATAAGDVVVCANAGTPGVYDCPGADDVVSFADGYGNRTP